MHTNLYLQNDEPHIFILNTDHKLALRIFCKAYAEGIRYPNYAWITLGYFDNHWWMEYEKYFQEIECKQPTMVMNTVLNRSLVLLPYPDKHNGKQYTYEDIYNTPDYTHDAVMKLAIALSTCLNTINYSNCDNCLEICYKNIDDYIIKTNFTGVSGNIAFTEYGERVFNTSLVLQYQMFDELLKLMVIGYIKHGVFSYLQNENVDTVWPEGIPPDGTPIRIVNTVLPVVVAFASLLGLGSGTFILVCFLFNVIFRNRKIVKLTSPKLNYLMIFGAVGMWISGLSLQTKSIEAQFIICTIFDRICSSWGYDICILVALVKTWRVHYILKKKTGTKTKLHDWKLVLVVLAILSVDVVLTIPLQVLAAINGDISFQKDDSTSPDKNDQGVIQEYYTIVCGSTVYYLIWVGITVIYKLILHIVGLVFAFRIRKIEIDALNDSKYSALIVYCSSFMLVLIFIIIPATADKPNVEDSIWSVIVFVLILMYLGLTFIPKMRALYNDPKGKNVITHAGNKSATQLGNDTNIYSITHGASTNKGSEIANVMNELRVEHQQDGNSSWINTLK